MDTEDCMPDIQVDLSPFPRNTISVSDGQLCTYMYGLSKDQRQVRVFFTCSLEDHEVFTIAARAKLAIMRSYTLDELRAEREAILKKLKELREGGLAAS